MALTNFSNTDESVDEKGQNIINIKNQNLNQRNNRIENNLQHLGSFLHSETVGSTDLNGVTAIRDKNVFKNSNTMKKTDGAAIQNVEEIV